MDLYCLRSIYEFIIRVGERLLGGDCCMSDYKRETYYLYNYENGRKRNNVGFARVEQMNGKCKITSRIRVPSMNGKALSVCLFIRERGEMMFLPIGKMQINNMTGELRSVLNSSNIMEMGYSMEEIKGMVIYDSLQKFFGSEWDDHKISFQEFKLAKEKDKRNEIAINSMGESPIKREEEKAIDTILEAASFVEEEIPLEEKGQIEVKQELEINPYKETGAMIEIIPEQQILKELEKEQTAEEQIEQRMEQETKGKEIDKKQETEQQEREIQKNKEQKIVEQKQQQTQKKIGIDRVFSNNLPEVFYQFPKMHPFEDDEMTDCVRIEPQDIGRLPMESWVLANNSFLLHSYYSYRHLLLARRVHNSGFEYVLCAPGICQNREQFMAAMFGFSDFKPARNVEDKNGEFGYWYMPVIIEEQR